MEIVSLWVIASIVVGIIASSRGRWGFGYFMLSLIFSPLLVGILAIALPSVDEDTPEAGPSPTTHVKCPDCRELILMDARVCKHCGCKLIPQTPVAR